MAGFTGMFAALAMSLTDFDIYALADLAPNAEGDIAYLCGNPNMVDACFESLKGYGLPVPQIRREKYVSSK